MVTKGIIKSIYNGGNKCKVRLPLFESAGSTEEITFDACICIVPGVYNGYKENDVVWVGFEDGHLDTPVVMGKLYLGVATESTDPRGTVNCTSTNVSEKANIPADTSLSMEVEKNVINTNLPYNNIQKVASTLNKLNTDVAQMDTDYGNQFKQLTNEVDGLSSEIIQTNSNIINKININDGNTETSFGWNLSSTDWSVFSEIDESTSENDILLKANFTFNTLKEYNTVTKKYYEVENLYINGIRTNIRSASLQSDFLYFANNDDISKRKKVINITEGTTGHWEVKLSSGLWQTVYKYSATTENLEKVAKYILP